MHSQNNILNLGKLEGSLLVFGGVYSNFQALEALLKLAKTYQIPASRMICKGDVVAYCAQPEECVQEMQQQGIHSISGNVEIQLRDGLDDCACDFVDGGRCENFSKQWYPFAQSQLSEKSLAWMQTLPEFIQFEYANKKVMVVHGSYHYTSEYIFPSTSWAIKQQNFKDTGADVILSGHSGLPFSEHRGELHWLNPGVIGMPANDGTPRVWFMILNDQDGTFSYQHHVLDYDFDLAVNLMRAQQLPQEYALTLQTGLWDNCEILPEEETKQQGIFLLARALYSYHQTVEI